MDKKVLILMSTYNGEFFLREQLESIINQEYKEIKVWIRDDGSTDKTKKILNDYFQKYPEIFEKIIYGENCGAKESFMKLIENVTLKFDYYAFADQDDVWKKNKVRRAIEEIEKKGKKCTLYFSNYDIVDKNLNYFRKGYIKSNHEYTLNNAIVQSMGLGCTMVFDVELLKKITNKKARYSNIIMHDYWVYIVASLFSNIIYDNESTMLYRQHGKNVFGTSLKIRTKILNLIKRLDKNNSLKTYKKQASEIYKVYFNDLSNQEKIILEKFINEKNIIDRIKNLLERNVIYNNKNNYFIKKIKSILYLFNRV